MENANGDFVGLEEGGGDDDAITAAHAERLAQNSRSSGTSQWQWWVKVMALCMLACGLAVIVVEWAAPVFMNEVVIPLLNWVTRTFESPILALLILVSIAIFPTLLLPSTPSIWIAGMSFGHLIGFPLVMAGVLAGVTLPYFIGSLFRQKIQQWLARYPKHASVLRLAGEGNWFHQFQAVVLLRISPFPYVLFNYAIVATDVAYIPYLLATVVGMVPDVLVTLYSGILLRVLADATEDHRGVSKTQVIFFAVGLCTSVVITIIIGLYTKRSLDKERRKEEPMPLLQ